MLTLHSSRFPRYTTVSCFVFWWSCFAVNDTVTATDDLAKPIIPFLESYCVKCHGPEKSESDLTLHDLTGDLTTDQSLELWEEILDRVKDGEMPPKDAAQPKEGERQKIIQLIETMLREKVGQLNRRSAIPTTRRLTNDEYENTMRDLLGFRLNLKSKLPNDPIIPYRFNNTAEYMRLGPEQLNRYLECARIALASAIVDPKNPGIHKTRREWKKQGIDRGMGSDEVGVYGNRRNSVAWGMGLKSFPKTGEYRIRIKASAILPQGVSEIPLRLVMGYSLMVNSSTLQMHPVGTVRLKNSPDHPQIFEFRGRIENHPVQPGRMVRGKRQPDSLVITPQNLFDDGTLNDDRDFGNSRNIALPRAVIEWIEFESPIIDVWPPSHHTQILFDSPLRKTDLDGYVRQVLKRFMDRAFRRPASESEVERFAQIYKLVATEMPTFEAAMRETLAMVLVSPAFLYHTDTGKIENRGYELASRLSYFLWGSMPDSELMELARENRLHDSEVMKQQVLRLLSDQRANDFVRIFTVQWLSLQKMKTVPINRELFPRFLYYVPLGERAGTEVPYRPTIRDHMIDETIAFVAELIKSNARATSLVDSRFAMLNQPLAAHYGVKEKGGKVIQGSHFRRVALNPESNLGGLLTHGSVLIGNGTGTAPHPIYRAVWLREAILGDEVPPPPAEVPALSDSAGESAEKALTIKDLLARHRNNSSCNACHSRLDPWGIPFERYNAIGRYQPKVPKEGTRVATYSSKKHQDLKGYHAYLKSINTIPVDSKSRVPGGPEVNGMKELKSYLLTHRKHEISENLLRRLLSYSMGRELTTRDRFQFQEIGEHLRQKEYRIRDMIIAICQSDMFQGISKGKSLNGN